MSSVLIPDYWQQGCTFLSNCDNVLAELIDTYGGPVLTSRGDAFFTLARAIVGQQISVKAADSIWNRLENALGATVTPSSVLRCASETLRAVGLSARKVLYLQELALFFQQSSDIAWHQMHDEEILTRVISIKGIGQWSAEMFLIFHLLRPDVWPLGDVGLRNAINTLYGKKSRLSLHEMAQLAEPWRPFRTVATWFLWRSIDPVVVAY